MGTDPVVISKLNWWSPSRSKTAKTGSSAPVAFVSIGLFKTGRIELSKVKECHWCFREEGLSLVALLLQGKEVMGCFAGDRGGSAIVLSEQVEVVAHLVSGG